jgi:hypothetical protein
MTPLSWEHWTERYQAKSDRVIVRGWPELDVIQLTTAVNFANQDRRCC